MFLTQPTREEKASKKLKIRKGRLAIVSR